MEQELGVDSTGINSKYKVAFAIKNDESFTCIQQYDDIIVDLKF